MLYHIRLTIGPQLLAQLPKYLHDRCRLSGLQIAIYTESTHLRVLQRTLEPNPGAAVGHCVPDQLTDTTDSPDQGPDSDTCVQCRH